MGLIKLRGKSAEIISTLEARVMGLESELKKKEGIISAKVSEIGELKFLETEADSLKRTLKKKEARVMGLESELKTSAESLDKREKELSASLQEKDQKIVELESDMEGKEKEIISAKNSEIEKLKSQREEVGILRRMKKSLGEKERVVTEKDTKLSEFAEIISTLEARVMGLESELKKKEGIISAKVSEMGELKSQREEVDIQRRMKKSLEEKETILTQREVRLSRYTDEISALKAKVELLEGELKGKRVGELNRFRAVKKVVTEKDTEISEFAEIISTLEARVMGLESELKKKEGIISAKVSEIGELKPLEKELDSLKNTLREKEARLKEFESELGVKERRLDQIKKGREEHELLSQEVHSLVLDTINRKLMLATTEEKIAKKLLNQLAEYLPQISDEEYKLKKKIHMGKLEDISQKLTELKELKNRFLRGSMLINEK
ncbi:MAG: hypothetical protein V3R93_03835 [Candidatus Hydrothermarchaeaceae archaeon]